MLKLVDISSGTQLPITSIQSSVNKMMTSSQYCYSNLSEHHSASIDVKSSQKALAYPRSLSEPRIQAKKNHTQIQTYQNPVYNQSSQEYILTNQDLMNQTVNSVSNVETYDNLDAQSAHQSRIESKYALPNALNYNERHKRFLNPIYNSMKMNLRDVKSIDRDVMYSFQAEKSSSQKSEPQTPQLSRQSTLNEQSFSESPKKIKDSNIEIDATEDDTLSLPSSLSIRGFKNFHNNFSQNLDSTEFDVECDDDERTLNQETNIDENCDESKLKMNFMQKQLETLTNLVHQALINKDLNRLEDIAQTAKLNQKRLLPKNANKSNINSLNDQAKHLKSDLNSIKKMHQNYNFEVSETFKMFANEINVS